MLAFIIITSGYILFGQNQQQSQRLGSLKVGKYTNKKLRYTEKVKLGLLYRDNFSTQAVMVLDLKPDDLFQIGFCDHKIHYSGKWRLTNDTLRLSDIFSYYENKKVADMLLKVDFEKGYIFYPFFYKKSSKQSEFKRSMTVLQLGGNGFDGVLDQGYRWGPDSTAKK